MSSCYRMGTVSHLSMKVLNRTSSRTPRNRPYFSTIVSHFVKSKAYFPALVLLGYDNLRYFS